MCLVILAQGEPVEPLEGSSPNSEEDGLDGERQTDSPLGFPQGSAGSDAERRGSSTDETRGGSGPVAHEGRHPELNDDLWLMVFGSLDIRDRVMLEEGVRGSGKGRGRRGEWEGCGEVS